jgi:hypothetical protein
VVFPPPQQIGPISTGLCVAAKRSHGAAGMTVVDSSAVIAILRQETDADTYLDVIDAAEALRMSAANHLEAAIVIDSAHYSA